MRFISVIIISTIMIYSQPLELYFPGYLNRFHIPVDTNWREYKIPYELLVEDSSLVLWVPAALFSIDQETNTYYPDSSRWWLDNLHFPTNSWQDFEDSAEVSIYSDSADVWFDTALETTDSSDSSLVFGYQKVDGQTPVFSLVVEDPLINYPVVPETVGVWLKAQHSSDLTRFIPLDGGNLWQWSNWDNLLNHVQVITEGIATDCTSTWWADDWYYGGNQVHLDYTLYTTQWGNPYQVWEEHPPFEAIRRWDFSLEKPDTVPTGELFLLNEGFQHYFDQDVFTKGLYYSSMGLGGSWAFAYGIGMVETYQDCFFHEKLTAARIKTALYNTESEAYEFLGDFAFENQLSIVLNVNEPNWNQSSYIDVFPDTVWRQYHLPVAEVVPLSDFDSSGYADLQDILLSPAFFLPLVTAGQIFVDEIVINPALTQLRILVDDFEGGIDEWQKETVYNGSELNLTLTNETPADSGLALEISFNNNLGEPFIGYLWKDIDSSPQPLISRDDELTFWLKAGVDTDMSVDQSSTAIPDRFRLHDNYPNPFNPVTTIRYELPELANVRLTIYSLVGREVEVLVVGEKPPGLHEIQWDASGLASGLYFYRLETGENTIIKKMLLIK